MKNYNSYYIPSNLDLDSLLESEQCPPSITKDKIGYILSTLRHVLCTSNRKPILSSHIRFVPMCSSILKKQVRNYRQVLDFLIKHGIIESMESYIPSINCKEFRFTDEFDTPVKSERYSSQRFVNSLKKHAVKRQRTNTKSLRPYPILDRWVKRMGFDQVMATKLFNKMSWNLSSSVSIRSYNKTSIRTSKRELIKEFDMNAVLDSVLSDYFYERISSVEDSKSIVAEYPSLTHVSDATTDEKLVDNKTASKILNKGVINNTTTDENVDQKIFKHKLANISYSIALFANQDFRCGRDSTSGRYHSPITSLKKEFRSCLSINGEQIVQIDVVNCQPFLCQIILDKNRLESVLPALKWYLKNYDNSLPEALVKVLDKFEKRSSNQSSIQTSIPSSISYNKGTPQHSTIIPPSSKPTTQQCIMCPKSAITQSYQGFQAFIDSVNNGTFYEDFIYQVKVQSKKIITRKEAKEAIYQTLFSDNRWLAANPSNPKRDASLKALFKKIYPEVYSAIAAVKRKDKKTMAILLQNVESHIIIERCCRRISKEKPRCPLFTVHDSIATTTEYVAYVQSVMLDEFELVIGVAPQLKTEPW